MISNERQYRITKAQAEKLRDALGRFRGEAAGDGKTHPRLLKAQADAMESQIESLSQELREYESLRSGEVSPPDLDYIAGIPRDLIRARIARGLSQKELAALLDMPEQQIQRYESTEYESVSLARISEIADALKSARPTRLRRTGS